MNNFLYLYNFYMNINLQCSFFIIIVIVSDDKVKLQKT